jgi:hypothetical protein
MTEVGYIKFYRQIKEWEWWGDIKTFRLFVYLLLSVNHTPGNFQGLQVEVGQIVTSLESLSRETGLSVQEVRTCLKRLKSTNEITSQTSSKYTVITVNNFTQYQESTQTLTNNQQASNKRSTNDQQQYKNDKNDKNKKKYKAGEAHPPLRGVALPEIGQGDCCVVYDCERHYYPKEWEAEAEGMDWSIEQLVRWRHHDGVYV